MRCVTVTRDHVRRDEQGLRNLVVWESRPTRMLVDSRLDPFSTAGRLGPGYGNSLNWLICVIVEARALLNSITSCLSPHCCGFGCASRIIAHHKHCQMRMHNDACIRCPSYRMQANRDAAVSYPPPGLQLAACSSARRCHLGLAGCQVASTTGDLCNLLRHCVLGHSQIGPCCELRWNPGMRSTAAIRRCQI